MIVKKDNKNAYLTLFSSVKLTRGYKRTLLVDFDRNKSRILPNDLYDLIEKCKLNPFVKVVKEYNADDQQIINEYVNFLEKHEYVIFTNKPESFPDIDLTWKSPNYISNAVVDVNIKSNHNYMRIIELLDDLGCKALDMRVFEAVKFENIVNLLESSKNSRLNTINLILPYTMLKQNINHNNLLIKYPRLLIVVFHSAPKNECCKLNSPKGLKGLLFTTNKITSPGCCGYVSEKLMVCNLELFSEAQNHNTCLNKKMSINVNGIVKNCNAMQENFGHYEQIDIKKMILENKRYTKLWKTCKDDIDICKDCEFRYVCVDCRANIKDANNALSKPSRCCYDPYTAKWESGW